MPMRRPPRHRLLPPLLFALAGAGPTAAPLAPPPPAAVLAPPLADRVPDEAVVYLGWAGADALRPAYERSHLRAVADHADLAGLFRQWVADPLLKAGADPKVADAVRSAGPVARRHPAAYYATAEVPRVGERPVVHAAWLFDAGADADALAAALQRAVAGRADLAVRVVQPGSLVVVADGERAFAPVERPLAAAARFAETTRAAARPGDPPPAVVGYADVAAVVRAEDQTIAASPAGAATWAKVRDATGLSAVQGYAYAAGFDPRGDWQTGSFLALRGTSLGLLDAFEPRPADPTLLALVPPSAGSVAYTSFDAAQLLDAVGVAMTATDRTDRLFHTANGGLSILLGRNLRRQVVGPLGPGWVAYGDAGHHVAALLNRPTDAAATADAAVSVTYGLAGAINARYPTATTRPTAVAAQVKRGGVTVTTLQTPVATPAVTVASGVLYLCPTADAAFAAAAQTPAAADVRQSPGFVDALHRLGDPPLATFGYDDLPRTAPLAYAAAARPVADLRAVLARLNGTVPDVAVPTLSAVAPVLSPALRVGWADGAGWHTRSVEPFPGAALTLGDPQLATTVADVATAALNLAAEAQAQVTAAAVAEASRQREQRLLVALLDWAATHDGRFPPSLGSLVTADRSAVVDPALFLRPDSRTPVPVEIANASLPQRARWVNAHADYVYLAADCAGVGDADVPVLAESRDPRAQAIAFADGRCQACGSAAVKTTLAHARGPATRP